MRVATTMKVDLVVSSDEFSPVQRQAITLSMYLLWIEL